MGDVIWGCDLGMWRPKNVAWWWLPAWAWWVEGEVCTEGGVRIFGVKKSFCGWGETRTLTATFEELSCRLNTRNFKISWCGGFRTG